MACDFLDGVCRETLPEPTEPDAANPDAANPDAASPDAMTTPDAAVDPADAAPGDPCDPVGNIGCPSGQKCSVLFTQEDPALFTVTCVPAGDVPEDGACQRGDVSAGMGYDDCQGGLYCLQDQCTEICNRNPDSCPVGQSTCGLYTVGGQLLFDDNNIGLCDPVCNVLDSTSCLSQSPTSACYLNLTTGFGACANIFMTGQQNQVCNFVNACDAGLGCVLADTAGNGLCAHFCDTATGTTAQGLTCDQVPEIMAGTPTCVQINLFYNNTPNVPDAVGMCIDCSDPQYSGLAVCP